MTIIQYFNEHILTFFDKRYNFAHRSFLLFLGGGVIQFARPSTLFAACNRIVTGAKL